MCASLCACIGVCECGCVCEWVNTYIEKTTFNYLVKIRPLFAKTGLTFRPKKTFKSQHLQLGHQQGDQKIGQKLPKVWKKWPKELPSKIMPKYQHQISIQKSKTSTKNTREHLKYVQ